jgi:hypothetical protein
MNETTPLLIHDGRGSKNVKISNIGESYTLEEEGKEVVEEGQLRGITAPVNATTTTTTSSSTATADVVVPVKENTNDGAAVTKWHKNLPLVEFLALTAIISGSLSMYWGISGLMTMMIGTTTAVTTTTTTMTMVLTTLLSQPMMFVHVIMSTCVVVLAPVVTVQKVQLGTMGTLREQQNKLRTQINSFNEMNDALTKSIASIVDETEKINQVNEELQDFAKSTGTTVDRLIELCDEQQKIHTEMQKHLQAKVLQQIITITLQSDTNQNYIVSEDEVNVLMERLRHIPGVIFHEDRFRDLLRQSEPPQALTLTDLCRIARNMQPSNVTTTINTTTNNEEEAIELTQSFGDPVFVFHPNEIR